MAGCLRAPRCICGPPLAGMWRARALSLKEREWDTPGSNRGLPDLQSGTLPTELVSQKDCGEWLHPRVGRPRQSGGVF